MTAMTELNSNHNLFYFPADEVRVVSSAYILALENKLHEGGSLI